MNKSSANISAGGLSEKNSKRRAAVLIQAQFNPRIKSYIISVVSIIMIMTIIGIPLIPLWLIFGGLYINRYFNSLYCELTTRALHFKKGVWFHTERTIPLDKIQDLTFKEGPLLRYFGLSILKVETAGQTVQAGADLALAGIIDAHEFRQMVLDQRDIVTGSEPERPEEKLHDNGVIHILQDIRDSLRSIDAKLERGRGGK